MTSHRPKLHIFEHKEFLVLLALGAMVTLFTFTLGVHYAKRIFGGGHAASGAHSAHGEMRRGSTPLEALPDKTPEKTELNDQAKMAGKAAEDILNQTLHDEVKKTGIKLEKVRQVDLPSDTLSKQSGETALNHKQAAISGFYTLQVGSFPNDVEAKNKVASLEKQSLKGFIQPVDVAGKAKRYHVFVGEFRTLQDAEKAGESYKLTGILDSFVVTRLSE